MQYTDPQKLENLEFKHPVFAEWEPTLKLITEMCAGGHELDKNKHRYLLVRDDEDEDIRRKRNEKFAPKNHLASAIRLQRTKLGTGSLITPDNLKTPQWERFFNNCDGKGKTFRNFLLDCAEQAIKTKYVYALIDLPPVNLPPGLNLAQQEGYLKKIGYYETAPRLLLLTPLDVINWEEDSEGIKWIKFRKLEYVTSPLGETYYNLVYYIVDEEHFTTFTFRDVIVDEEGYISQIKGSDGKYRHFNEEKDLALPISRPHYRGKTPVNKYEIPDILWATNQAYLAQKLIYGLDTNLVHTTVNAGYIQKWGKPYIVDNGNHSVPVPGNIKKALEALQENLGDEHFVAAELFEYAEMEGKSVTVQQSVIDGLVSYIYSVISLNIASAEKSVLEQSGRSKEFDLYLQTLALQDYGSLLVSFGQELLKNVARAFGIKDKNVLDKINLSGMNKFDIKSVAETLDLIEKAAKLPGAPDKVLPDEIYEDLAVELSANLSRNSNEQDRIDIREKIREVQKDRVTGNALPEGETRQV